MAVGSSQTGARVLKVLEAIAFRQPIGIRELARVLGEDKSAVHRAVATLVQEGWARTTLDRPVRWEMSPRILAVADAAHGGYGLLQRARPALERLRDECGETLVLIVTDASRLIVSDVVESLHELRVVPHIGSPVTTEKTAAGRAILPFLDADRQAQLLGGAASEALRRIHAEVRRRGYALSVGETNSGATSTAAAIFDTDGRPCAAIAIIGPSERMRTAGHEKLGQMVRDAALSLSRGRAQAQGAAGHHEERAA